MAYKDLNERAIKDTISYENGNFYWNSDNSIIPEEEIDSVLSVISRQRQINRTVKNLSNFENSSKAEVLDSLSGLVTKPEIDIENMTEADLIEYNKNAALVLGLDTIFTSTKENYPSLDSKIINPENDKMSWKESQQKVDNTYVQHAELSESSYEPGHVYAFGYDLGEAPSKIVDYDKYKREHPWLFDNPLLGDVPGEFGHWGAQELMDTFYFGTDLLHLSKGLLGGLLDLTGKGIFGTDLTPHALEGKTQEKYWKNRGMKYGFLDWDKYLYDYMDWEDPGFKF